MEEAIRKCEKLLGNIRQTTLGARGMAVNSPLKAKVIMELLSHEGHKISQKMLLKKIWMHYVDMKEVTELMASFEAAGMITIETMGNELIYVMVPKQVAEYKKFFSGKTK